MTIITYDPFLRRCIVLNEETTLVLELTRRPAMSELQTLLRHPPPPHNTGITNALCMLLPRRITWRSVLSVLLAAHLVVPNNGMIRPVFWLLLSAWSSPETVFYQCDSRGYRIFFLLIKKLVCYNGKSQQIFVLFLKTGTTGRRCIGRSLIRLLEDARRQVQERSNISWWKSVARNGTSGA